MSVDLEVRASAALRALFEPLPVRLVRRRGWWEVILGRDERLATSGLRVGRRQTTIHDALREVSELLRKVGRMRLVAQLERATGREPIDLPEEWFSKPSTIYLREVPSP